MAVFSSRGVIEGVDRISYGGSGEYLRLFIAADCLICVPGSTFRDSTCSSFTPKPTSCAMSLQSISRLYSGSPAMRSAWTSTLSKEHRYSRPSIDDLRLPFLPHSARTLLSRLWIPASRCRSPSGRDFNFSFSVSEISEG